MNPGRIDPELMAPTLALARPELEGIRRRYAPPEVLIVGPQRGVSVEEGLAERGWRVTTCEGPGKRDCPLMRGGTCELRTDADVAIVHVDPSRGPIDGGLLARIRCAAEGSAPALIALDGRFDRARLDIVGAAATIGAARSVSDLVGLVEQLHSEQ